MKTNRAHQQNVYYRICCIRDGHISPVDGVPSMREPGHWVRHDSGDFLMPYHKGKPVSESNHPWPDVAMNARRDPVKQGVSRQTESEG